MPVTRCSSPSPPPLMKSVGIDRSSDRNNNSPYFLEPLGWHTATVTAAAEAALLFPPTQLTTDEDSITLFPVLGCRVVVGDHGFSRYCWLCNDHNINDCCLQGLLGDQNTMVLHHGPTPVSTPTSKLQYTPVLTITDEAPEEGG